MIRTHVIFAFSLLVIAVGVLSAPLFVTAEEVPYGKTSGLLVVEDDFGLTNAFDKGKVSVTTRDSKGGYLSEITGNLLNIFLGLVGLVSFAMMIYGGAIWMMARGNEEEATKGRNILQYATVGLIVAMSAYVVVSFVVRQLEFLPSTTGIRPVDIDDQIRGACRTVNSGSCKSSCGSMERDEGVLDCPTGEICCVPKQVLPSAPGTECTLRNNGLCQDECGDFDISLGRYDCPNGKVCCMKTF